MNLARVIGRLWITLQTAIIKRKDPAAAGTGARFDGRGRLALNLKIKLDLRMRVSIKKYFQKG